MKKFSKKKTFGRVDTLKGFNNILTSEVFKSTFTNYKHLRLPSIESYEGDDKIPAKVKLENNIFPAEFCRALVELISIELQAPKKVKVHTIEVVELGKTFIGIKLQCNGTFSNNIIANNMLEKDDSDIYHGFRSNINLIERAVNIKMKFIESENEKQYHPFRVYQNIEYDYTNISLILGDIFSNHIEEDIFKKFLVK